MKKIIIISIILLLLLAACFLYWLLDPDRMVIIEPDLVGEYEVIFPEKFEDYSYGDYAMRDRGELTWWEQYNELKSLEKAEEAYQVSLPHTIDFEKEIGIASFGRKIVDIQYENNFDNAFQARIPIFTYEEEYQGNKMFLYTIRHWEGGFLPPSLDFNLPYRMVDGERVPF